MSSAKEQKAAAFKLIARLYSTRFFAIKTVQGE